MPAIKKLDENVINQIAAGEVIERPASVIKELVENSIDAGATKVEVEIMQGGRTLRVADNGSGITSEDLELAFSRHATSKISEEKDLWKLNSLGFRGEALASIISISKLTCLTRTESSDNGYKLVNSDNGSFKITPAGCAVGTTIEISDLFYNVPARLKFMKKHTTEAAAILDTLQHLAIAHPEVSITCRNQSKTVLKTTGSNDLCLCVSEIFSKDLLNHLLQINAVDEVEKYFVNGVVTDPTFTKNNRKSIYIIINGRYVKCPIILKAVDRAVADMMPSGRFPMAVLNLMIPPDQIDVNVHPAKREVRYKATNSIFGFIVYAIKKAIKEMELCVECSKEQEQQIKESIEQQTEIQKAEIADSREPVGQVSPVKSAAVKPIRIEQQESLKESAGVKEPVSKQSQEKEQVVVLEKILPKEEVSQKALEFQAPLEKKPFEREPEQLEIKPVAREKNVEAPKDFKVIGQVFNTYIILENKDGLQIVDQHIASERALYDKLKKQEQAIAGQRLLLEQKLQLSVDQVELVDEYTEVFEYWGYEIEKNDTAELSIKQVPQMVAGKNHKELFNEILAMLEQGGGIETIEDNILKTIACHSAVRAGDSLTTREMELVIEQWNASDYPYTCPHGRQICHKISLKELASYFDRH